MPGPLWNVWCMFVIFFLKMIPHSSLDIIHFFVTGVKLAPLWFSAFCLSSILYREPTLAAQHSPASISSVDSTIMEADAFGLQINMSVTSTHLSWCQSLGQASMLLPCPRTMPNKPQDKIMQPWTPCKTRRDTTLLFDWIFFYCSFTLSFPKYKTKYL